MHLPEAPALAGGQLPGGLRAHFFLTQLVLGGGGSMEPCDSGGSPLPRLGGVFRASWEGSVTSF